MFWACLQGLKPSGISNCHRFLFAEAFSWWSISCSLPPFASFIKWASTQIDTHLAFTSPYLSPIKSSQNILASSVSNTCSNWRTFGWCNLCDLFCPQNGFRLLLFHEFQGLNAHLWWERCLLFGQNSSLKYVFLQQCWPLRLWRDQNHSWYYYVNSWDCH